MSGASFIITKYHHVGLSTSVLLINLVCGRVMVIRNAQFQILPTDRSVKRFFKDGCDDATMMNTLKKLLF